MCFKFILNLFSLLNYIYLVCFSDKNDILLIMNSTGTSREPHMITLKILMRRLKCKWVVRPIALPVPVVQFTIRFNEK